MKPVLLKKPVLIGILCFAMGWLAHGLAYTYGGSSGHTERPLPEVSWNPLLNGFVPPAAAEVAGMNHYELVWDYDFKKAVRRVVEDCEVEEDGSIRC